MKKDSNTLSTILVFALLFMLGAATGYLFISSKVFPSKKDVKVVPTSKNAQYSFIKVYYPFGNRLQMEERRVNRVSSKMEIANATIDEFLMGPAGSKKSYVPKSVKSLGIYIGIDDILYIDLSEEFRSDFQGDALSEFLLLRGLYESMVSNVYGINGVKILIEGEQIESIGGHISIVRPISEIVQQPITEE